MRWFLVPCLLALSVASASAQDKSPKAAPPSTSAPTSEADSFAYAAPAFIKELDTQVSRPAPVPPSPPRYGGVLHFPAVVRAFDPTAGYRPELALVWDTLTEWEAIWYFPEVQRTPVIRKTLVTDWQMQNPSTWIFKLRQGVKFHNRPPVNGREMTAEDVKYSYELLKDKAQYSTRAALVKTITVIDKYTVKFELSMPDPKFYLNIVDSLSPVIVPREAVEAPGGLAENPIGTGAFMLKEFSPGDGALLVKNPDYYLKDKDGRPLPYVDAVRLYFTKDAATETALFRTKQLDVMRVSTLDQLYALMKTVARSAALPRALLRLGRLRPEHGAGQGALQRRARPPGALDGHQPRHRGGGDQQGRRRAVRPVPLGAGRLHQARGLLVRQPRPQLPVQPQEGQGAPGRGRLSQRPRPRAGVGRVPGLHLRRVRAARRALLRRRRRAREAQAARDVDVAGQGRRRPALQPRCWPPSAPSARARASWTGSTCATTRRFPRP